MIRVKGRDVAWHAGITISELLAEMNDPFPYAAALVNEQYVSRSEFDSTGIPDNAEIIFIAAVGGG